MINLRQLRREKNITQQQLADALDLQRNVISRYESETREPDVRTAIRIADYFGVSVEYLLSGEGPRNTTEAYLGDGAAEMQELANEMNSMRISLIGSIVPPILEDEQKVGRLLNQIDKLPASKKKRKFLKIMSFAREDIQDEIIEHADYLTVRQIKKENNEK